MSPVKQALLEIANKLPDECTWEDVMYQLYVRQKIEDGLRDVEAGRLVSEEEIEREFGE